MASALGMNLSSISNTNAHSVSQSFFDDLEGILARGEAGDLDSAELFEALQEAQKTISNCRKEIRELKAKNADLTLQRAKDDPKSAEAKLTSAFRKFGHFHHLFYTPFVDLDAFIRPRPTFEYDSPFRYTVDNGNALGLTAELYHSIPDEYHKLMESSQVFRKEFKQAAGSIRSTAILRFREKAGVLFDLRQEWFAIEFKRSTIPKICQLLGRSVAQAGQVKFLRFPPIIYRESNTFQISGLFLNEIMMQAARIVIYGKTATGSRSGNSYQRSDREMSTTVGLISYFAMMVRYMLSDDQQFTNGGIGAETQINWLSDFEFYKQYLINAQEKNPTWLKEVFSTWDAIVFPQKAAASTEESEVIRLDDGEEINQMLAQLRFESNAATVASLDNTAQNFGAETNDDDDIYIHTAPHIPLPPLPPQVLTSVNVSNRQPIAVAHGLPPPFPNSIEVPASSLNEVGPSNGQRNTRQTRTRPRPAANTADALTQPPLPVAGAAATKRRGRAPARGRGGA